MNIFPLEMFPNSITFNLKDILNQYTCDLKIYSQVFWYSMVLEIRCHTRNNRIMINK